MRCAEFYGEGAIYADAWEFFVTCAAMVVAQFRRFPGVVDEKLFQVVAFGGVEAWWMARVGSEPLGAFVTREHERVMEVLQTFDTSREASYAELAEAMTREAKRLRRQHRLRRGRAGL